jgi:hypothetical protein
MRNGLRSDDLYLRGAETLVASWEAYARVATGAAVQRWPGVAIAVFPNEPERAVYNNALLERGLTASERTDAIGAMEGAYATAGVTRERPGDARPSRTAGYRLDESTRAMGMALDDIHLPRPKIELGPPDWFEYLRILGVPPGFLRGADPAAFHVLVARLDGETVATASAFDLHGDCGSTTSRPWSTLGGADWAPPSPPSRCTTRARADVRPRACNPRRRPSTSTRL